jgi:hypothetical protein
MRASKDKVPDILGRLAILPAVGRGVLTAPSGFLNDFAAR